jgi:hypothetical protein
MHFAPMSLQIVYFLVRFEMKLDFFCEWTWFWTFGYSEGNYVCVEKV